MATISPCAVGSFSCLPIAAFNHHLAVTHDHAAEGIVAARGFRDGHPHEALVVRLHPLRDPARLRRRRHEQRRRGDRQSQSSNRARDQSPAAHIFGWRCDAITPMQSAPMQHLPVKRSVFEATPHIILMAGGRLSKLPGEALAAVLTTWQPRRSAGAGWRSYPCQARHLRPCASRLTPKRAR